MVYYAGDFSFVKNISECKALKHDYIVIDELVPGAWEALKNHDPKHSFIWNTNGEIWNQITSLMWNGHSGASYSLNLRILEKIAKHGWDNYVKSYTN
jgi:hypothetical protein